MERSSKILIRSKKKEREFAMKTLKGERLVIPSRLIPISVLYNAAVALKSGIPLYFPTIEDLQNEFFYFEPANSKVMSSRMDIMKTRCFAFPLSEVKIMVSDKIFLQFRKVLWLAPKFYGPANYYLSLYATLFGAEKFLELVGAKTMVPLTMLKFQGESRQMRAELAFHKAGATIENKVLACLDVLEKRDDVTESINQMLGELQNIMSNLEGHCLGAAQVNPELRRLFIALKGLWEKCIRFCTSPPLELPALHICSILPDNDRFAFEESLVTQSNPFEKISESAAILTEAIGKVDINFGVFNKNEGPEVRQQKLLEQKVAKSMVSENVSKRSWVDYEKCYLLYRSGYRVSSRYPNMVVDPAGEHVLSKPHFGKEIFELFTTLNLDSVKEKSVKSKSELIPARPNLVISNPNGGNLDAQRFATGNEYSLNKWKKPLEVSGELNMKEKLQLATYNDRGDYEKDQQVKYNFTVACMKKCFLLLKEITPAGTYSLFSKAQIASGKLIPPYADYKRGLNGYVATEFKLKSDEIASELKTSFLAMCSGQAVAAAIYEFTNYYDYAFEFEALCSSRYAGCCKLSIQAIMEDRQNEEEYIIDAGEFVSDFISYVEIYHVMESLEDPAKRAGTIEELILVSPPNLIQIFRGDARKSNLGSLGNGGVEDMKVAARKRKEDNRKKAVNNLLRLYETDFDHRFDFDKLGDAYPQDFIDGNCSKLIARMKGYYTQEALGGVNIMPIKIMLLTYAISRICIYKDSSVNEFTCFQIAVLVEDILYDKASQLTLSFTTNDALKQFINGFVSICAVSIDGGHEEQLWKADVVTASKNMILSIDNELNRGFDAPLFSSSSSNKFPTPRSAFTNAVIYLVIGLCSKFQVESSTAIDRYLTNVTYNEGKSRPPLHYRHTDNDLAIIAIFMSIRAKFC